MTAFTDWIDARDSETLARAWAALDVKRVEVGEPRWYITAHGAAQLAAAFLGWPLDRVAWLASPSHQRPPYVFQVERNTSRCFLEESVDDGSCTEYWTLHEERDDDRGVQYLSVSSRTYNGTYDGGGTQGHVVRVYNRATSTGASIFPGTRKVATIGAIELGALQLFSRCESFALTSWQQYSVDDVRGLVAQLATELDAHYDACTSWPGRTLEDVATFAIETRLMGYPKNPNMFVRKLRFESAPRAICVDETRFRCEGQRDTGWIRTRIEGLPWGYGIETSLDDDEHGIRGSLTLRLPIALGKVIFERLARVPGIKLG